LSFDWREYLRLAKQLGGQADEAAQRSAISRAYYSVFSDAEKSVHHAGGLSQMRQGDTHSRVWNAYEQHRERRVFNIGIVGKRLQSGRVDADYKAERRIGKSEVDSAVAWATQIRKLLDDLG
jgi:hypothetical protein